MNWLYLIAGVLGWTTLYYLLMPDNATRPIQWLARQQFGEFLTLMVLLGSAACFEQFCKRQFGWDSDYVLMAFILIPMIIMVISIYTSYKRNKRDETLSSEEPTTA